jgi:hypothetical protein
LWHRKDIDRKQMQTWATLNHAKTKDVEKNLFGITTAVIITEMKT